MKRKGKGEGEERKELGSGKEGYMIMRE